MKHEKNARKIAKPNKTFIFCFPLPLSSSLPLPQVFKVSFVFFMFLLLLFVQFGGHRVYKYLSFFL